MKNRYLFRAVKIEVRELLYPWKFSNLENKSIWKLKILKNRDWEIKKLFFCLIFFYIETQDVDKWKNREFNSFLDTIINDEKISGRLLDILGFWKFKHLGCQE